MNWKCNCQKIIEKKIKEYQAREEKQKSVNRLNKMLQSPICPYHKKQS
jgi:hypothetical protein